MFGRLLPKEGRFYDLFNAHAEQVVKASRELVLLMQDFGNAEVHARLIDEAEHSADRITAEAMRLLHKTFITPIDREQIHQLVNAMDDICDLIQDVTESITLYDVRVVTPEMMRLADVALKCCERVKDVIALLERDGHAEAVLKTCDEIDRLESDADRELRSAISRLFREEQDVREIIKLKVIYEQLEAITDRCEDVANLAEGVVLENS
ncbi:MAG: DUF47 family protein [Betaproteobacteria bacterium]|nr:DUF47 family protein [Betaproteobacteria bacterium]